MQPIQPTAPQTPPSTPIAPSSTPKAQQTQAQDPPSKQEMNWAMELEKKVMQGYQPTSQEIEKYTDIAERVAELPEDGERSVKGLLDYPKDVLMGLANFSHKSFAKNLMETARSAQDVSDSFSGAWEGLRQGRLDDTIESTIEGFGDVFNVIGNTAQSLAAGVGVGVSGGLARVADGVDQAAEWAGDKLAGNDNEWSKTGASVVRVLGGENSNENVDEVFMEKLQEGLDEAQK